MSEIPAFQPATAGMGTAAGSQVEAETEVAFPTESEHREIELLAYLYWESRGGQGGSAEEDWLHAEQVVRARRASA